VLLNSSCNRLICFSDLRLPMDIIFM
jgi:hypothetical protein